MSETTQDLLAKAYEMQRTDAALAMVRERDYWERRALQAEAQLLTATPPTPDRAAVRAALVSVLRSADGSPSLRELSRVLGLTVHPDARPNKQDIADALLRPTPLPADVQAVVEKIQPIAEYEGGIGLAYMDTEDVATFPADLRTLLAHLTREAR